jgi:hypothetical protein
MTREQAMVLMTYLGRAGPIVHVTMAEAAALQPALQAIAGVAFGTLTCSFAPVTAASAENPPPYPSPTRGEGRARGTGNRSTTPGSPPRSSSAKRGSAEGQK